MSEGVVLVLMLLGLLSPSDTPPLAASAVPTLSADCDMVVFADVRGVVDTGLALLGQFSEQSFVDTTPELGERLAAVQATVDDMRLSLSAEWGFDPFTGFDTLGFCGRLGSGATPEYLIELRAGAIADLGTILTAMAASGLSPHTLSNGTEILATREDGMLIGFAWADPQTLVIGTEALLTSRLVDPPTVGADSLLGRLSELAPPPAGADVNVRLFIGIRPGEVVRGVVSSEAGTSAAELLAGLSAFDFATTPSGVVVLRALTNDTVDAYRDWELLLMAIGEAVQAQPHVVRGFLHMMAFVAPFEPDDEGLTIIGRHHDDLLAYFNTLGVTNDPVITFNSDSAYSSTTLTIENMNPATLMALLAIPLGVLVTVSHDSTDSYYEEPVPMPEPLIESHP